MMAGTVPPTAAAESIITALEVVVITLNVPAGWEFPVVTVPTTNVMTWEPTGRAAA